MTNKSKKPWKALNIELGTLIKIDFSKPHIPIIDPGMFVMFYSETKDNVVFFFPGSTSNMIGLFLGNVNHTQPDARILIDQDIYHIHPKYLEIINCEKEKNKTGSFG
jgi:hypothetical protein